MSQVTPPTTLQNVSSRTDGEATVPAEWVLASKYEQLTGVTRETVKQRKKTGVWKVGVQVGVVQRRLYVNVKAADQWIRDQVTPNPRRA
ncbi:excisionase [Paracidovorax avenae]|uniref:excisionase n=1 Tax=Paracidovorax avenae TaxID=80867 RepID=UPI001910F842|nr:excisionase [Paracidovorax avenae]